MTQSDTSDTEPGTGGHIDTLTIWAIAEVLGDAGMREVIARIDALSFPGRQLVLERLRYQLD